MNELAAETPSAGGPFRRSWRGPLRLALDLVLPPLRPSCREPVGDGVGLCTACRTKLSFIKPHRCARLGIPFLCGPGPGLLSMEAIADPPAYHRARAAVRFDDISRALVHALKYGDRLDLAPMMGRWTSHAGRELLAEADALVPVPLHWRRLWARRFNQSAMPGLSRSERARNSKAAVAGCRLIVVDDVLTSGATVDCCARALLRAGAANVDVLIFARVADPARTSI